MKKFKLPSRFPASSFNKETASGIAHLMAQNPKLSMLISGCIVAGIVSTVSLITVGTVTPLVLILAGYMGGFLLTAEADKHVRTKESKRAAAAKAAAAPKTRSGS